MSISREMLNSIPAPLGGQLVVNDARYQRCYIFVKNSSSEIERDDIGLFAYRQKVCLDMRSGTRKVTVKPTDILARVEWLGRIITDRDRLDEFVVREMA